MSSHYERRRVLVIAAEGEREALADLLIRTLPLAWDVLEADSMERARFNRQLDPCDVMLLDDSLMPGDPGGMPWLTMRQQTPILLLSDAAPDVLQAHFQAGITHWLPRRLAQENPRLLTAMLQQAAQGSDLRQRLRQREEALAECRRKVNRLVGLLWQAVPVETHTPWYTHRHMLERLHEEVERSQRHGDPLAVVLGEIAGNDSPPAETEDGAVANWAATQVSHHKRRCDVAGQYGPHGFMLLLPHTNDKGAAVCCRRLQELLEERAPLQVSFGIASFSADRATANSLLGQAEERLEQARGDPEDRLVF